MLLFENFTGKEEYKKIPHTIEELINSDYIIDFISEEYGDDWEEFGDDGQTLSIYGIFDIETGESIDSSESDEELHDHELDSWDFDIIEEWFEKEGFEIKK